MKNNEKEVWPVYTEDRDNFLKFQGSKGSDILVTISWYQCPSDYFYLVIWYRWVVFSVFEPFWSWDHWESIFGWFILLYYRALWESQSRHVVLTFCKHFIKMSDGPGEGCPQTEILSSCQSPPVWPAMGAGASHERLSRVGHSYHISSYISLIAQTDLDFLASHTDFSEEQITEWYRGFKQDCPEGKLTYWEPEPLRAHHSWENYISAPRLFSISTPSVSQSWMPKSCASTSSELSTSTKMASLISRNFFSPLMSLLVDLQRKNSVGLSGKIQTLFIL